MHYSNYQTCAVRPQTPLSEWDILSSLPTALIIVNAQGLIIWLNPAAETMLGYNLLNKLWIDVMTWAFIPKPDDGHEISLANGRRVHVDLATLDTLPGILLSLTDITTSRNYEKAKENEQRLVSIGTMTAQLAHQIRTPLASAILYVDHLTDVKFLDSRAKSWLVRIKESHSSIEQQIRDLLLFARGTSINPSLIDVGIWCEQLSQRAKPYLDLNSVELLINNQLIKREAMIHGESLMGAVLNLLINSIQANASKINLLLASIDDSGIQISVRDNGNGMSDSDLKHAFSPFYTTKAKGTGLGLAVVYAVVQAHAGGWVSLDSIMGEGTQVNLYLP